MGSKLISLVGMPGAGKSVVGRQLAKRIGWSLVDVDAEIELRLGCSIRSFFERSGEEAFRDLESDVLAEVTARSRTVISTGGGVVLRHSNRVLLKSSTWVVYLRSTPEELFRRLRHDKTRPLLQVEDPLARLRELFQQRDSLYADVAHYVVETGRPSVSMLVNTVLMQIELAGLIDITQEVSPGAPPA
jgi:shikimate kinase